MKARAELATVIGEGVAHLDQYKSEWKARNLLRFGDVQGRADP